MSFNAGAASIAKIALSFLLFSIALFGSATGGRKGNPIADEEAVGDAIEGYHEALAAMDSVAARALLGDDVVVMENGYIENAGEYLSHHLPADMAFANAVPSRRGDIRVTVQGDVAWATSTARSTGKFKGREIDSITAELIVLSRTDEGWRIRAIHWSSRKSG